MALPASGNAISFMYLRTNITRAATQPSHLRTTVEVGH